MPIHKQIVVRDLGGNVVSGAELLVYAVTFDSAGVPVQGALVTTLRDGDGNTVDQGQDPPPTSDLQGVIAFMLPAGVYWIRVTTVTATYDLKAYPVGRAAERDVGTGEEELPLTPDLLEGLVGAAALTEGNDGQVVAYDHSAGQAALRPLHRVNVQAGMPPGTLLTPAHAGIMWTTGSANPAVAVIQADAQAAQVIPVGTVFTFLVQPGGTLMISTSGSAVLNGATNTSQVSDSAHSVVTLFKVAADTWVSQGTEESS